MKGTFEECLIPFQEKHYENGFFFFIQDNAKPHKYGPAIEFLIENFEPNILVHPAKNPQI